MENSWAFGWTPLLTIIGFLITIVIAAVSFRTFERWRSEEIEKKKIDAAVEALTLIREAKWVFEGIRSVSGSEYEWKDMPQNPSDDGPARQLKGRYYAIWRRVKSQKEFFDRAWKLQVQCGTLFGQSAEDAFVILQQARRDVEVSAEMLMDNPTPEVKSPGNLQTWEDWKCDVWEGYRGKDRDAVAKKLEECTAKVESICRPVVDSHFGKKKKTLWRWFIDWMGP